MSDFPILFTGAMVRCILAESKTQTRRLLRKYEAEVSELSSRQVLDSVIATPADVRGAYHAPRHKEGDLLWVRESYRVDRQFDGIPPREVPRGAKIWYEADEVAPAIGGKLRPSIFMPRWASRITLQVERVDIERLQDMDDADALAEGIIEEWGIIGATCAGGTHSEISGYRYYTPTDQDDGEGFETAVEAFASMWDFIHGKGAWDENPVVSATAFKPIFRNIGKLD